VSTNQVITLVSAIAQLVGVVIWPAVLVFFLIRFRGALTGFLGDLGEFTFRAPGVEASGKRQEAAAALGAAVAARVDGDKASETNADPRDVARALPSPRVQQRLQGARILWVDDRPSNNRFERQTLEALGIEIDTSISTEDAMKMIRRRSYDLIISDMGRPDDPQAGYTLLDELRESGNQTPYVLYTRAVTRQFQMKAREHGVNGITDMPQELIGIVTSILSAVR
jgi:CheY-like chemotaxis protein